MVRQFYIQLVGRQAAPNTPLCLVTFAHRVVTCCSLPQNEIHGLIERYSVNESLVEEIEKLREENRKLKANY